MSNKNIFYIVILLVIVLFVSSASFADTKYFHSPRIRAGKDSLSTNWGGYAVTAANGAVSDVKGSWIVPAVTCPSTGNQYSSYWVGIDGYSSSTVEQTGTDSDCSSGTPVYYAWYEFYPKPFFQISSISVSPGDVISAEVRYLGSNLYTVSITDLTTHQSFSTSKSVKAKRSSAEWIAEAPSGSGGILPLANFGTAYYGLDNTNVGSTNYANVGGILRTIGSFGSSVQPITMVTSSGAVKARQSLLSTDGTSFSMQWISTGP